MALTHQQAIDLLRNNPSDYTTKQQLEDLVSQASVGDSGGTTIVLCSGV